MTNYSRSVLKSNGLRHSKNLPVKFGFSSKPFPQISPKSYRHNAVSNRFSSRFSISLTNGPRSLSLPKAGTHSPFGERSHTTAHTPKQGPSFPRPQRGFALPVKSILFRHAFIYIHFPVLCGPPPSATAPSQTIFHRVFQPLAQTAHVRFHRRKRVHARLRSKNRTQRLTRRNRGRFGWGGGITTLGAFRTFRKPCVARG